MTEASDLAAIICFGSTTLAAHDKPGCRVASSKEGAAKLLQFVSIGRWRRVSGQGRSALICANRTGVSPLQRILLVEDDSGVRLLIEHVLLDEGYEVDAAGTFEDGRERLTSQDYDLVVADGRLPDGTGVELADIAEKQGTPTLILTGYAFILRELALDREKCRVLLKPIRPMEIVEAVRAVLG
jgi:CheY-like chemotaxis protein